jgi:hypothetical protein
MLFYKKILTAERHKNVEIMDNNKMLKGVLPKVLVQNMINNYRKNQLIAIENNRELGLKEDANSTWIDLAGLKEFITTIENAAPDSKDLGIRIYYAAYPDADLFGTEGYETLADFNNDEMTKQYGKKHTLILIPTTKINGVDTDFNPSASNTNSQEKASAIIMAKNHFQLSPPHPVMGQDY